MGAGESTLVYRNDISPRYDAGELKINTNDCKLISCTPPPKIEEFNIKDNNIKLIILITLLICIFIIYKII